MVTGQYQLVIGCPRLSQLREKLGGALETGPLDESFVPVRCCGLGADDETNGLCILLTTCRKKEGNVLKTPPRGKNRNEGIIGGRRQATTQDDGATAVGWR